jgi:pyruvate,orthophosphate dikinase
VLDQRGVGQLIVMAKDRGRQARPDLKVGVCGEHGGDPSSVAFFAQAGLDYVSCSPFRWPFFYSTPQSLMDPESFFSS